MRTYGRPKIRKSNIAGAVKYESNTQPGVKNLQIYTVNGAHRIEHVMLDICDEEPHTGAGGRKEDIALWIF